MQGVLILFSQQEQEAHGLCLPTYQKKLRFMPNGYVVDVSELQAEFENADRITPNCPASTASLEIKSTWYIVFTVYLAPRLKGGAFDLVEVLFVVHFNLQVTVSEL